MARKPKPSATKTTRQPARRGKTAKPTKAEAEAAADKAHAAARAEDLRPFPEKDVQDAAAAKLADDLAAMETAEADNASADPKVTRSTGRKRSSSARSKTEATKNPAGESGTSNPGGGGSATNASDTPTSTDGPNDPGHPQNSEGDPKMPKLIFSDARAAQNTAEEALANAKRELERRKEKATITPGENHQLKMLETILETNPPGYALEDLYLTLRQELASYVDDPNMPVLDQGQFGGEANHIGQISKAELRIAMAWGMLHRDGIGAPRLLDHMKYDPRETKFHVGNVSKRFNDELAAAVASFNTNLGLYRAVLDAMAFDGDINGTGQLRAADWVSVTETLIKKGLNADSPGLPTQIRAAINDRLAPSNEKVTSTQQIILPDLEKETAQEVQRVNLEAAQAIYFAAMMDEARLFDSVDKLAELFQIGALPLEKGPAGEYLYHYIRQTPDRISPYERRNTYARVFGAATGDPNGMGGTMFRNFDELWMRFVSSVSDWYRKNQVENLFATQGNFVPSQEQVRKTGLDLAANLSLYCYGGTWFVASELQKNISEYINLLSSPEIRALYGAARDMWQVIDQISVLEFGQPVNTIRARTKANAGAAIIGWLEKHAAALSDPGSLLINPAEVSNPRKSQTHDAINDPSDYDLVTACEQWLAIEGVGSDIVEINAAASPSAITSTAPVRVPPAAQEILGAFGFEHQGNGHDHNGRRPNGDGRMMN
ncbi:hypothetical protein EI983_14090 [Roseovarius faecimaris]|uniref:Uncharacterized protein n=1 Tax=Roseovarius faecimaris TaxID=2494550 RepID=A0A6I6IQG7_9RHOB|nr:hypothetical protein [Roseovarius faecimaris]QGX99329.1 hypothetical protein EI983_14090 [Roseovarius faecimaris]